MKPKHLFKVLLLGDSSVGKTSLLSQFTSNQFSPSFKTTIGADFSFKQLLIDDTPLTLQIWDTAGQQRYQSLGSVFYKGSDCCVIVFDLTDVKSWKNVEKWRALFFEHCGVKNEGRFPVVVVGNKVDLPGREVGEGEVKGWLEREKGEGRNVGYYETSAKSRINVEKVFCMVGRMALGYSMEEPKLGVPQAVRLQKCYRRSRGKKCC